MQSIIDNIGCNNCKPCIPEWSNNRSIACGWLPDASRKIFLLDTQKASSSLGWAKICIKAAVYVVMTTLESHDLFSLSCRQLRPAPPRAAWWRSRRDRLELDRSDWARLAVHRQPDRLAVAGHHGARRRRRFDPRGRVERHERGATDRFPFDGPLAQRVKRGVDASDESQPAGFDAVARDPRRAPRAAVAGARGCAL